MLAAIAPAAGQTWFFKAVAPSARLGPHHADFLKFIDSLRFAEGEVKWTLPEGWHEEKAGSADRYATLCIGKAEPHLELTVTRLEGEGGGVLANVNRWRGQMGLEPLAESELPRQTERRDVAGTPVTVVSLEGPRRPSSGPAMGSRPAPPSSDVSIETIRRMFSYDLPAGWHENPKPGGGQIFELRAGPGNQAPTVTLTVLSGTAGGLAANVNRWRGQVGLEPVDEGEAHNLVRSVPFLRGEGSFGEYLGKDRGILVVFALRPEFSFFLKMDGPADTVRAERAAFESFAKSIRLSH
jgi:hypothetical protein